MKIPAALAVIIAVGTLVTAPMALAAGAAPVALGAAAPFAVLAGGPVTSSGLTTITGDIGNAPAGIVTGFPPGTVEGTIHAGDAVALQAKGDLSAAYDDAAGREATGVLAGGPLDGHVLKPGVYDASFIQLNVAGTLTLDGLGDPGAVWIFKDYPDLVTAPSSAVRLINGGQACNVFWQVSGPATLGAGSTFAGTILALDSITIGSGVTLDGRALAINGGVTMADVSIFSSCSRLPDAAYGGHSPTGPGWALLFLGTVALGWGLVLLSAAVRRPRAARIR